MDVSTKEEYENLETKIKSNEKLTDKLHAKRTEKLRPKIIVYKNNDKLKDEELITSLESQNEVLRNTKPRIEIKMKTNRGSNLILSFEPGCFHKVLKLGNVNVGWERLNTKKYIRPML